LVLNADFSDDFEPIGWGIAICRVKIRGQLQHSVKYQLQQCIENSRRQQFAGKKFAAGSELVKVAGGQTLYRNTELLNLINIDS
jgi:hypothetical protein